MCLEGNWYSSQAPPRRVGTSHWGTLRFHTSTPSQCRQQSRPRHGHPTAPSSLPQYQTCQNMRTTQENCDFSGSDQIEVNLNGRATTLLCFAFIAFLSCTYDGLDVCQGPQCMVPQFRFEADVPSTHDQPWATVEPVRKAPRYVLLVVTIEYAKPRRPDESATPVVCQCGKYPGGKATS
jgi:hypothetical protein